MTIVTNQKRKCSRQCLSTIFAIVLLCIVGLTVAFVLWETRSFPNQNHSSSYGEYSHAAVSCDAPYCSGIASSMLERGGSVADAAVAGLLCMGTVNSHSSGISGGFSMVVYNRTTGETKVIIARERAPGFATEKMFHGDSSQSQIGGLAVAVPGEIKGFWELHQAAGKLPWKDLFAPSIKLCREGFKVSQNLAKSLREEEPFIKNTTSLAELYINKETGEMFKEGEIMTRNTYAVTLERIAEGGEKEFYTGKVAEWFVEDLRALGGNITMEDMANYKAEWVTPLKFHLSRNLTLLAVPPPGGGLIFGFVIQVLDQVLQNVGNDFETLVVYQRIIETFKHAYAQRTHLGDPGDKSIAHTVHELMRNLTNPDFIQAVKSKIHDNETSNSYQYYGAEHYIPEDHGTAHFAVIGPTGDAISVTTTINLHFGSKIRSTRAGIIYNCQMDDFSSPGIVNHYGVPPQVNNFIKPGKRPISSTTPSVFIDGNGNARLAIGTAGGTKITTSTSLVSVRNLWFNENLKNATDAIRVHHQLFPMKIQYEKGFNMDMVSKLQALGHDTISYPYGASVTSGVARTADGTLFANTDIRKGGAVAGF